MTPATKYINGLPEKTVEMLAQEDALQIKLNRRAYSVTMCSPSNNIILAVGLLYTEGILQKTSDIISITEEIPSDNCTIKIYGDIINVDLIEKPFL